MCMHVHACVRAGENMEDGGTKGWGDCLASDGQYMFTARFWRWASGSGPLFLPGSLWASPADQLPRRDQYWWLTDPMWEGRGSFDSWEVVGCVIAKLLRGEWEFPAGSAAESGRFWLVLLGQIGSSHSGRQETEWDDLWASAVSSPQEAGTFYEAAQGRF